MNGLKFHLDPLEESKSRSYTSSSSSINTGKINGVRVTANACLYNCIKYKGKS